MKFFPKAIIDLSQAMHLFADIYADVEILRQKPVSLNVTLGTASDYYFAIPIDCSIVKIYTVINGALATADETVKFYDNGGTELTDSVITIAHSGSAAGDVDTSSPGAINQFTAGDVVKVKVGGENDNAVRCEVTMLLFIG